MIINKENVRIKPNTDNEILMNQVKTYMSKILNKKMIEVETFKYLFKRDLDKWVDEVKK